jgi:hypothetical protein
MLRMLLTVGSRVGRLHDNFYSVAPKNKLDDDRVTEKPSNPSLTIISKCFTWGIS